MSNSIFTRDHTIPEFRDGLAVVCLFFVFFFKHFSVLLTDRPT